MTMINAAMTDPVYTGFLAAQFRLGTELAGQSEGLRLTPFRGNPPTHYLANFRCDGLAHDTRNQVVIQSEWTVGIHFPEDYLRRPVEVPRVLSYLGPHPRPWHPNIAPPFICLHVTTGLPLTEILYALFDLLTWNLYATTDEGLNHAASQWARHQDPARFPVDRRPLRRRIHPPASEPSRPIHPQP